MIQTRKDRSLVAWMLYACVLFNLLSCGFAHGQMMGLVLNGAGGQFCSVSSQAAPDMGADLAVDTKSAWASKFTCPVCSSIPLSLVFLFCLAWLIRTRTVQRIPVEIRSKAPPRYSWPSANPRASPTF